MIFDVQRHALPEGQQQRLHVPRLDAVVNVHVDLLRFVDVPGRVIFNGMRWWVVSAEAACVSELLVALYHEVGGAAILTPLDELRGQSADRHGEDQFALLLALAACAGFLPLRAVGRDDMCLMQIPQSLEKLTEVDLTISLLIMGGNDCMQLVNVYGRPSLLQNGDKGLLGDSLSRDCRVLCLGKESHQHGLVLTGPVVKSDSPLLVGLYCSRLGEIAVEPFCLFQLIQCLLVAIVFSNLTGQQTLIVLQFRIATWNPKYKTTLAYCGKLTFSKKNPSNSNKTLGIFAHPLVKYAIESR